MSKKEQVVDEFAREGVLYRAYNYSEKSTKAIATVACGESYLKNWEQNSLPGWLDYAERHDVTIFVFLSRLGGDTEAGARSASWDKLLVPQFLGKTHPQVIEVCLLDTDFAIGPFAPNIFENHTPGKYSVVSQEKNMPFSVKEVRRRIALLRREYFDSSYPLDSLLQATPSQLFELHGLNSHDDYFCAGLIMLDETNFDSLADCYFHYPVDKISSSAAWEEPFVNDWIQSRSVNWLPYEYQSIWLFEMAALYPWLYDQRPTGQINPESLHALGACLLNRYFVHFAGSWGEADYWHHVPLLSKNIFYENLLSLSRNLKADFSGVSRGKLNPPPLPERGTRHQAVHADP
jgi:hypothetical protein